MDLRSLNLLKEDFFLKIQFLISLGSKHDDVDIELLPGPTKISRNTINIMQSFRDEIKIELRSSVAKMGRNSHPFASI